MASVEEAAATAAALVELRRRAKRAIVDEDYESALDLLNRCLEVSPSSVNLYRLRCLAFSRLGQYDRSLEDAEEIARLEPNSLTSFFHKGSALYHVGDFARAARTFQEGLRINGEDKALREGFWNSVTMLLSLQTPRTQGPPPPSPPPAELVATASE